MADITFAPSLAAALRAPHVVLVAPKAALRRLAPKVFKGRWTDAVKRMLEDAEPGAMGAALSTYTGAKAPQKVTLGVLPETLSRHNSPTRCYAIHEVCSKAGLGSAGKKAVLLYLEDPAHYAAAANAVGRTLPLYDARSTKKERGQVLLLGLDRKGERVAPPADVKPVLEGARWAASLVDRPTAELTAADFVAAARQRLKGARGVKVTTIVGEQLLKKKLGGIHAVGRAAAVPPRLLVLEYGPRRGAPTVALVGKGVVYDTGGLNLKPRTGMEGMKGDMGGAAAVAGAFWTLVQQKVKARVVALVPLAENAIGPDSYRPDDILTMHSGKTVEINNTDAEGRLLLADGASYAVQTFKPDVVIDAATLTGAQLVATGKRHAGVVTNRDGLEQLAVRAGRVSGDLVHPLPFAPEFYQSEFKSHVADMRNSVKDRANAQTSCAAQFIWSHIAASDVPWLHVDLAGPAFPGARATGFGVALLSRIVQDLKSSDLKR